MCSIQLGVERSRTDEVGAGDRARVYALTGAVRWTRMGGIPRVPGAERELLVAAVGQATMSRLAAMQLPITLRAASGEVQRLHPADPVHYGCCDGWGYFGTYGAERLLLTS